MLVALTSYGVTAEDSHNGTEVTPLVFLYTELFIPRSPPFPLFPIWRKRAGIQEGVHFPLQPIFGTKRIELRGCGIDCVLFVCVSQEGVLWERRQCRSHKVVMYLVFTVFVERYSFKKTRPHMSKVLHCGKQEKWALRRIRSTVVSLSYFNVCALYDITLRC